MTDDQSPTAIVRAMDHLILLADDAAMAERLYRLFSETWELPVVWPLEQYPGTYYNPGGFTSGGVWAGNVFIEFLYLPMVGALRRLFSSSGPRFTAIAYEPVNLSVAEREIEARGLTASDPLPYLFDKADFSERGVRNIGPAQIEPVSDRASLAARGPIAVDKFNAFALAPAPGREVLYQTIWFESDNCLLLELSKHWLSAGKFAQLFDVAHHAAHPNAASVFLCDFHPLHIDIDACRNAQRQALAERSGGPLGITSLHEITFATPEADRVQAFFRKLFEPYPPDHQGRWQVDGGPAVRVVPAEVQQLAPVTFRVADLRATARFLADRGTLGPQANDQLAVAPESVEGLDIRFRQA